MPNTRTGKNPALRHAVRLAQVGVESQQMSGADQMARIKLALVQTKCAGLVPAESTAHLLLSAVVSCTSGKDCQVMLVPNGTLQTEWQQRE